MATVRPTSISPSTTSSYTGGDWTPYGYLSPSGGMDLLHQSVQWNTEEQIRQAQLSNLRLSAAGGGSSYGGGSYGGSTAGRTISGGGGSIGGGSTPAASMSSLKELLEHISGAYGQTKSEAQRRYEEMLGAVEGTTSQREADVRSAYSRQGSNIMQNLARLGMSGTTIAPTMQMGVSRERESALNRLADELLGTKLGVMRGGADIAAQLGIGEITQKIPIYQKLAEEKARGSAFGPVA